MSGSREANADAGAYAGARSPRGPAGTTREGQLLGGGAEAAEFTMMPDLDTFAVLPWDKTVAREFQVYAEAAP